ncbi:putative MFS family arabinose efflux permease [Murinocardiopsis flavida]|uniref:Putative MFS family arabinose efflux permease n=1 Tax=Murinocardiopsis flavida TaxID=645275 RepID=A0A2P8DLN5_9ACTN|nr:MFS transporter [Murinocardiopsis flavida]PSK98132.1 putative MFS family arabinose efflux permease [Murinocardiopsis flavida]
MSTLEESAADRAVRDRAAHIQRRAVATLMLSQVVGGVGMGTALAVGGLIAERLTGSQSWSGLAVTMITLGAALFALPLAAIAARRGRRPGLSTGWFVAALGALVVIAGAHIGVFPLFLLGMVLFGAGTATNLQSRYAAADLATERRRGRDLSVVVWATTIGSVAGPNLTGPGAAVAVRLGLMPLLGPFVFAAVVFVAAGLLTLVLLRPDPLVTAREMAAGADQGAARPKRGFGAALRAIGRTPMAVLAVTTIVASHAVMVAVMTMTPVHMAHGGAELTVIGLTISLHIAGMFALSPVVGWLADRFGRVRTLLAGQGILIVSAVVSGMAGHSSALVATGLVLLGLGWSFGLVSASTLLAESLDVADRPGAQGLSDLAMNLGGAGCGALSGVVLAAIGFGGLNGLAALLTLPVVAVAVWAVARERTAGRPSAW